MSEKSWFDRNIFDRTMGQEDPQSKPTTGVISSIPISVLPNMGSQVATVGGMARNEDSEALKKCLEKGIKRGFTEFLQAYTLMVDTGISPEQAALAAVKLLANQGVSLPEVVLAFSERIDALNAEKTRFNAEIDGAVQTAIVQANTSIESSKKEIAEKERAIVSLREQIDALNGKISESESTLTQIQGRKDQRVADFQTTFQAVFGNINSLFQKLSDMTGGR